ncbi:MAG: PQQ-dependent sugar dehydrogenase, partial [Flavobacteriales bacterium]|nr:PQQ-dependent sugar dehydrogenase [Flavobacteriales bacterium]
MGKKFLNLFILFSSIPVYSQNIQLVPFITSGLNLPVGCYFAPGDDHLYIVQQRGKIMLATSTGTVLSTPFLDITSLVSQTGNERGLLGLAFHPDYVNNGYFYVNYTKASNGNTVIARYQRSSGNPLQADPNSQLILMEITQPYSNHNGGQLHFGPDGFLYIGMGDGGSAGDPQNNAQNMNSYLGKMLRIDVNGGTPYAVPPTNPFINNANAKPEIWALGLRNPWCFSFDKVTGDLWIADVGQNAWEEIDFQPASSTGGENYGWRCYEGAGHSYNTAGCGPPSSYTNPVAEYSHSGGHCSVTGGYVYRGALYGVLYGKYIYTDYCSGAFWATYPSGNGGFTSQSLTQLNSPVTYSLSAFGQDHNGELYVVGRDNHRIYKLTATGCQPSADIFTDQGYQFNLCPGGSLVLKAPYAASHTYQWFYNGTPVSSSGHTLAVTQEGTYSVIVTNTAGCSDTATATVVQVNVQPPVLSLPNSPLCSNDPPSPLVASPTGGEWSGPDVN